MNIVFKAGRSINLLGLMRHGLNCVSSPFDTLQLEQPLERVRVPADLNLYPFAVSQNLVNSSFRKHGETVDFVVNKMRSPESYF